MINSRSKYADDHSKPVSHMPAKDDPRVTNKWNKETVAFKMTMSQLDTEQDCTAIKDSNSHYKFRTTQEEGKLLIRQQPCICSHCLDDDYSNCEVKLWFDEVEMRPKGRRNPNADHLAQQENEQNFGVNEGDYEVQEILDRKVEHGVVFYKVAWKGYTKTSWVSEDDIEAPEAVKDWEICQSNLELEHNKSSNDDNEEIDEMTEDEEVTSMESTYGEDIDFMEE